MEVDGGRIRSLTAAGERWEVNLVVNGAGPWAAQLGEMCGAPVPVKPYRRMGFTSQPMAWVPDTFPMLIDWSSGIYMHKESGGMLGSVVAIQMLSAVRNRPHSGCYEGMRCCRAPSKELPTAKSVDKSHESSREHPKLKRCFPSKDEAEW